MTTMLKYCCVLSSSVEEVCFGYDDFDDRAKFHRWVVTRKKFSRRKGKMKQRKRKAKKLAAGSEAEKANNDTKSLQLLLAQI